MLQHAPEGFESSSFDQNRLCYWHQGWEVFPGVRTPGRSPVESLLAIAGVPLRLDGLRVADIGAWNGCVAFECERRGAADVVALSLEDPSQTGFNYLKEILQARTRYVRGTIYDLDPDFLGTFDIVVCFGVIYHLRYPVLGLDNLRRIATDKLFIESHVLDESFHDLSGDNAELPLSAIDNRLAGASLMQFYKGKELSGDASNWFSPSMRIVADLLDTAGFEVISQSAIEQRGYWSAKVRPGLPPFLDKIEGSDIYEGQFYGQNFQRLFGDKEKWRR